MLRIEPAPAHTRKAPERRDVPVPARQAASTPSEVVLLRPIPLQLLLAKVRASLG